LRAVVLSVDEIALEMRRQHASRPRRRRLTRTPHLIEHMPQRVRRTRNRRRTERGDAITRQSSRDRGDRVASVEGIHAVDAVHVHVDETGDDVVPVKGEQRVGMARGRRVGPDFSDPPLVDDQRARREDAVGQHQGCTRQDDHRNAQA
jgi:hypothetical protein